MIYYHSITIDKCLKSLKTSFNGLNNKEVEKRLKRYGPNKLPLHKPLSNFIIFFSQFNNPLILILFIAGVISLILKDVIDASIILVAIIINTFIGFLQESKANNSLSKLKSLIEHKAIVVRDGKEMVIDSSLLTVGDIIVLKAGNRVPADGRLIEAVNLQINESSLTGESISSSKRIEPLPKGVTLADRNNMVYAGTIVVSGFGRAVITSVGFNTEIGQIAKLVTETKEEDTPLQKRLKYFSKFLGISIFLLSLIVVLIGLWRGHSLFQMFLTGVALAVASIPEGLSVAVTVILALGMQSILKQKALVRKLIAAETLGSTTVICSDKTGTLTEGRMHVAHIVVGEKEFEVQSPGTRQDTKEAKIVSLALQIGMMCNDAIIENPADELASWRIVGSPTDSALLSAAIQSGLDKNKLLKIEPKIDELPFSSDLKFMITLHQKRAGYILYEKGAPEKILEKSSYFYHHGKRIKLNKEELDKLKRNHLNLTKKGLRVIAVALREFKKLDWKTKQDWSLIDKNLIFVAFLALKDPLRPEAKETINVCKQAGIRPVIITGDHMLTAKAIASDVGIQVKNENIVTGDFLDKISDEELKEMVNKIDVYARVNPHHKLRIVKALQSKGEVVAMTGDGINDSPALRAADIGISLGTGTDIAKENADIILLDNNFKTIVAAIKQGRIIFANIRKVITFLLSDNFSQIILVAGSIILGAPLALLPAQILWMNIIGDGLPDFSLAFEKGDGTVMKDKPIKRDEPLLNREMKIIIFVVGVIRDLLVFVLFFYLLNLYQNWPDNKIVYIRSFIFVALSLSSLIVIFSIRVLEKPIWHVNLFSNKFLIIAILFSFTLLLLGIYVPFFQNILSTTGLDLKAWLVAGSIALLSLLMIEIVKYYFIKLAKK